MTSRGRSVTPSRRYGEILGSIFSNGSEELEENQNSSISQVKQKFRERRQRNSTGRSFGKTRADEQRQNPSSPQGQYYEPRTRSPSRPLTPDSRPPTPDRTRSNSRPPTSDRNRLLLDSPLGASRLEMQPKGISLRSLVGISPQKRRVRVVDSSDSSEILTTRVAKQISKNMKSNTEGEQQVVGAITRQPLKKSQKHQFFQSNRVTRQVTTTIEQQSTFKQKTRTPEELSAKVGPNSGASVSISTRNVNEMIDIIKTQNEQIMYFETCLKKRSNDIEQLALELKLSKKNESRLNLELEMHDLKYSMYDDYRRMMDRQRFDNTSNKEESEKEGGLSTSFFTNSNVAFIKLDQLDRLYEKSKVESEHHFSILREEYDRVVSAKSVYDEETLREYTNNASSNAIATTTDLLEKRIRFMESENEKNSLVIKEKEEELKIAKLTQNDSTSSRREKNRFYAHNLEKQTLENKIVALEIEIGFTSGHVDDKTRTRRYHALEKNLDDYVTEIMGLEDQLNEKEKIISKLKDRHIEMNFGSDKRNNRESDWSMPSGKWYEQSKSRQKGELALRGNGIQTSKSFDCIDIAAASTVIIQNKGRESDPIGNYKIGMKKTINKRASDSSARIAMLRKRLDALANDHYSVGTEETQRSSKTSPS